jgi:hypothetical protein
MRCRSVGSGTVSQTQSATQLTTQSSTAHDAVIRVYDEVGNIERVIPFDDTNRKL